jgi:predicted nucleic acid-binding protein
MLLLESNIFIYSILPEHKALNEWMLKQEFAASEISLVEVLGYHRLPDEDARKLEDLFNMARVLPMSRDIVDKAIHLRRKRKMGLADSFLAATALDYNIPLATRNTGDFDWIEDLEVVNPMLAKGS